MSKLYRFIVECAQSHADHGDLEGAEAIMLAADKGKMAALKRYPQCAPAIRNAVDYARQKVA